MNKLKPPKNALSKTKYLLILIALTCITACSGGSNEFNYDTSAQRLTSLTIDEYPLDFNSEKTGPYKIETSNSEKTLSVHFESSGDYSFSYSIQNSNGTYQKTLDNEKHFVANIAEGANLISIQLYDSEKDVFVTYTIYAYRLSSAARITSFSLYDFASGSGTSLGLAPSFSEAVFDYSTTVPYSSCAIAYQITAKNSGVSMQTNGSTSYERNVYYHNLTPGVNYLDTTVVAEDFSTSERYTIAITRTPPTTDQIESNAQLLKLDTDGDYFQYICGINDYTFFIDNNTDTINLDITPEIEGAKVFINNNEINPSETQTLQANESAGTATITAISANGGNSQTYTLTYIRRSHNIVNVETTAELITAIRTAEPNDEIRVSTGEYLLTTEETGMLFSDRSGTAIEPIYLSGEQSFTDDVIIKGTESETLITLTGSHWNISGITLQNAGTAVHLHGANNITLKELLIEDIYSTAISLTNGANNNTIKLNSFSQLSGGDTTAAIHIGDANFRNINANQLTNGEISNGNTISHNIFINMADSRAINLDAGASNSNISFNSFIENTQALDTTSRAPLIQNFGINSVISHNSFEFDDPRETTSLIQLGAADLHVSWATGVQLIQNLFDLNNRTVDAIANLSTHTAMLAENLRSDDLTITYGGSNYDFDSLTSPIYTIQTNSTNTRCLGIEEYEIDNTNYWLVELEACDTTDTSQHWKIVTDKGIYAALVNQSQTDGHMRTATEFEGLCSTSEGIYQSNVYLTEDEGGYVERWLLDTQGDTTYIRNKKDTDYGLTVPGEFASEGTPLMTCPITNSESQQFTLVPVAQ